MKSQTIITTNTKQSDFLLSYYDNIMLKFGGFTPARKKCLIPCVTHKIVLSLIIKQSSYVLYCARYSTGVVCQLFIKQMINY